MLMINKVQKQVCVIGLGYIGLPTACVLATSGYNVHGVDTNYELVSQLQSASFTTTEPKLQELFLKVVNNNHLTVSTRIAQADIYIIAVPTPLSLDNKPDLSYIDEVVAALKRYLRAGNIIIIESTCPIGTTDAIAHNLQSSCQGIYVACCPERAIPGNILHELVYNDRIIGGVDEVSTSHAVAFYKSFIKGEVLATKAVTAEAVKLTENTFRDVNIAFANELSMIADDTDLDVNEIIRLANRHPRVQVLDPGPGVGGHCLAIDPWFLVAASPNFATIISKARDVNIRKTDWVIQKIRDVIKLSNVKVVACFGLTYKPNVKDIRNSSAQAVAKALSNEISIICIDPYIPNTSSISYALANAEMIIGLVAHDEFKNISSDELSGKVLLDFAGAFK
jgi:UDP-N-acetyl-D-mannosaminuronic acid dehydrogenase